MEVVQRIISGSDREVIAVPMTFAVSHEAAQPRRHNNGTCCQRKGFLDEVAACSTPRFRKAFLVFTLPVFFHKCHLLSLFWPSVLSLAVVALAKSVGRSLKYCGKFLDPLRGKFGNF